MVRRTVAWRTSWSRTIAKRVGGASLRSSWISSARIVNARAAHVDLHLDGSPHDRPIDEPKLFGDTWRLHLPKVIGADSNVSGWSSCTWSSTSSPAMLSSAQEAEFPLQSSPTLSPRRRNGDRGPACRSRWLIRSSHAGGGRAACLLQLTGDARHRMAEGVEQVLS